MAALLVAQQSEADPRSSVMSCTYEPTCMSKTLVLRGGAAPGQRREPVQVAACRLKV